MDPEQVHPEHTTPCLPPVIELGPDDIEDDDAPWTGFEAEVSRLRGRP